jgi:DNA end-binding protein Ku
LTSDYRRDLRVLLEAKLRGEEIAVPEPVAEPATVIDLLDALKASVAAAKKGGDEKKRPAKPKTAPRSRAAKSA